MCESKKKKQFFLMSYTTFQNKAINVKTPYYKLSNKRDINFLNFYKGEIN